MARIKVRFELNKGRIGAPLSKLGKIAEQAERFLKAIATEAEIDQKSGEWLATNFRNGSVSYDAEFQGEVNSSAAEIFNRHMLFAVDFDPDSEGANGMVTEAAMAELAGLGKLIEPDEVIGIGIYNGGKRPKWRRVSYHQAARIRKRIETPLPAHGSIQGIFQSLEKEAARPHFKLRELAAESVVRCYYTPSQYGDVVNALKEKTAVLHVSGQINYERASRSATELKVETIEEARIISPSEFESLFGSMPDFTGDLNTDEYIDFVRGDG